MSRSRQEIVWVEKTAVDLCVISRYYWSVEADDQHSTWVEPAALSHTKCCPNDEQYVHQIHTEIAICIVELTYKSSSRWQSARALY
jgi:hypothetical protein